MTVTFIALLFWSWVLGALGALWAGWGLTGALAALSERPAHGPGCIGGPHAAGDLTHAEEEALSQCMSAGVQHYFLKPVHIDEFHHAEARTYRRIIDHLTPRELLGLTATPERADGTDVRSFFDGRTAAA